MKKGRSVYQFQLNCDLNQVNQLVQGYINANKYIQETKNNETYYKAGDIMVGYRYLNYIIIGNTLTIYAWVRTGFGDMELEQTGLFSINAAIMNYKSSLMNLFREIENLNINKDDLSNGTIICYDPYTGQPIYGNNQIISYDPYTGKPIYSNQTNNNQLSQKFQNEIIKKQENLCEIGFWMSIIGLIISLFGITYGLAIYILEFYFASQGLNTKKKSKAKAAMIMGIISIIITILYLILSLTM